MQTALTSRRHGWIDGSFGVEESKKAVLDTSDARLKQYDAAMTLLIRARKLWATIEVNLEMVGNGGKWMECYMATSSHTKQLLYFPFK